MGRLILWGFALVVPHLFTRDLASRRTEKPEQRTGNRLAHGETPPEICRTVRERTQVPPTLHAGGAVAHFRKWRYNHGMMEPSKQSKPQDKPESPDAIQEAIEYGIDISLLKANLALTPAERIRRHQIALDTVEMLQKAKRL